MASVEIQIPPRSPYVGVVRLAMSSLARAAGFDEEKVDDLRIAVSEACSSAVLSRNGSGSDTPLSVSWSDDGSQLVIEISDPIGSTPEPAAGDDSLSFSARAVMSEALLRSLVDGYETHPNPAGGTTTRLLIDR